VQGGEEGDKEDTKKRGTGTTTKNAPNPGPQESKKKKTIRGGTRRKLEEEIKPRKEKK